MTTLPDKALAACRRYVEAQAEVKRLTREIGVTLYGCPREIKSNSDEHDSHLYVAYRQRLAITPEVLDCCPCCLAAHALVLERKRARVAFGVAKRNITCIGKAAQEATS